MRRLSVLTIIVVAMLAMIGSAVPAGAGDANGKGFVNSAFNTIGVGGAVLAFGPAADAQPPPDEKWSSVRIFAYDDSDSDGRVYCGDVWNVVVTVNFGERMYGKDWLHGAWVTHTLDGAVVGATDKTPVRWSPVADAYVQVLGTFLAPGTLDDGFHTVKALLEHDEFGVLWDPDPLVFEVNDSAC